MPGPAIAIAASAVGSAVVGLKGAKDAAKAQNQATQAGVQSSKDQIELYEKIFDTQQENQKPWREVGAEAITSIGEGLKTGAFTMDDWQFTEDPGYEFRRREGEKMLERSAAVGGNFLSGDRLKAGLQYNQNFASDEYGRAFSREAGRRADNFNFLSTAAGGGQAAVQSGNADAAALGRNVGGALQSQGNFLAQGAMNQGQISQNMYRDLASVGNTGIENYLTYKLGGFG